MVEALLEAGLAVYVVPAVKSRRCGNDTGRRATRTTASTPTSLPTPCVAMDTAGVRCAKTATRPRRCERYAGPERTSSRPGSGSSTSSGPIGIGVPGRIRPVLQADSAITLSFLRRFPTAAKAAWLSPARMAGWLRSVGYNGGIVAEVLYGRLAAAAPGLVGAEADARGEITLCCAVTAALNEQIASLKTSSQDCSPPTPINTSSRVCRGRGRSGQRASWLRLAIAVSGSPPTCAGRARGACPSTRQSGKTSRPFSGGRATRSFASPSWISRTGVAWRPLGCRHLRRAIDRGCRHPHAIRILARAWLRIIWRCWQDGVAFDPDLHRARFTAAALDIGHSYVVKCCWGCLGEGSVEVAGEVALDAAADFPVGLSFCAAALDVGLGGLVAADAGDGDGVDGAVELAVAEPVKPVPVGPAG